jgi:hypothetical protein
MDGTENKRTEQATMVEAAGNHCVQPPMYDILWRALPVLVKVFVCIANKQGRKYYGTEERVKSHTQLLTHVLVL